MKSKLPIVTMALVPLACLSLAFAEEVTEQEVGTNGQDLILHAAQHLAQQPSVAARIRQRAHLAGRHVVGAGTYRQLQAGGKTLVRLDLKLQVGGTISTLQQINDGTTLWIRRDSGDQSTTGYVNLGKLRDASRHPSASDATPPNAVPPNVIPLNANSTAVGGLQHLLCQLHENIQFEPPTRSNLGGVPVWIVRGHWKPRMLALFLPDQADSIFAGKLPSTESLPAHVPDTITVTLGRDDFIPLFPYRIEYSRQAASPIHTNGKTSPDDATKHRMLVTMELFEVQRGGDLDPSLFIYKLGDQKVEDWTDRYLHAKNEKTRAGK